MTVLLQCRTSLSSALYVLVFVSKSPPPFPLPSTSSFLSSLPDGLHDHRWRQLETLVHLVWCNEHRMDPVHMRTMRQYLDYSMLYFCDLIGQLLGYNSLMTKLHTAKLQYLWPSTKKIRAVPRGNTHAMKPGAYITHCQWATRAWQLLATTSIIVPGEHQSWRRRFFTVQQNYLTACSLNHVWWLPIPHVLFCLQTWLRLVMVALN